MRVSRTGLVLYRGHALRRPSDAHGPVSRTRVALRALRRERLSGARTRGARMTQSQRHATTGSAWRCISRHALLKSPRPPPGTLARANDTASC